MWKNLNLSETAKGLSASIQQATEVVAKKAEEAQDSETPLGSRLSKGWGSVIQATKHAVDETRKAVEKEQSRLFQTNDEHPKPIRRRHVQGPLDVDALRDAEVVYITERIITMSHPALESPIDDSITPNRKLAAIAHLLEKRHAGRYMIWNLSEVEYDVDIFNDQVLTFSFPGSPSPPLGLLLKLLLSMESWLKADTRNVAVVHCLTGKGRTSTVLAALLCWIGEAGFSNIHDALEYIAKCKKLDATQLTIPSQRRYATYFCNMLDGVRPSQPPLLLKRVIMSEAPKFAKGPPLEGEEAPLDEESLMGCAPYIQIFKAGQLLHTVAASVDHDQGSDDLPFCHVSSGPIAFDFNQVLQGDVLVRCRHLQASGQRVSMFRAALHTGYIPPKVMRLGKQELDGACNDKRFGNDFFLDLVFEPCNDEMLQQHLQDKVEQEEEGETVEAKEVTSTEGGVTVTASAYDSMLHRDSRFWDVIAARREQHSHEMNHDDDTEEEEHDLEMWGPTIGRKRDLRSKKKGFASKTKPQTQASLMESAFSIGGDLDFFDTAPSSTPQQTKEPKRDELMEALMALDDDPVSPQNSSSIFAEISETPLRDGIEEIVFEAAAPTEMTPASSTTSNVPAPTIVKLPPPKKEAATSAVVADSDETAPEKEVASKSEVQVESKEEEEEAPKEASTPEPTPAAPSETTTPTSKSKVDETDADLDVVADLDTDADLDALLASSEEQDIDDLADDMGDLDFDDDDLQDLEQLLSGAKK